MAWTDKAREASRMARRAKMRQRQLNKADPTGMGRADNATFNRFVSLANRFSKLSSKATAARNKSATGIMTKNQLNLVKAGQWSALTPKKKR